MTWVRVVVVALGVLASSAGVEAAANKRGAVERLAAEAAGAYKSGDYEKAVDRLERAYELEPAPTLVYNLAKAYDKWGRAEQALAQYLRFMALPEAEARLRAQAEGRVRALAAALPRAGARDGARPATAPPPTPGPSQPPPRDGEAGASPPAARAEPPPLTKAPVELPNNPKAGAFLFHLGKAYERLNQTQKAIQHYERYLAAPDADPKLKSQAVERIQALGGKVPSGAAP